MRKYLILLLFAMCPTICIQANHFPTSSYKSVKCIEHNDTSIYILKPEGLEVVNKITGKKTVYNMQTGYFMEQWRVYELQKNGTVGLNSLAIRPDTIWVGSNDGVLTSISDGKADTTMHYCNLSEYEGYDFIRPMGINSIVFDSKGTKVLGGENCINVIYPSGEEMSLTFPSIDYGTEIWQMVIDRYDNIWISSTTALSGNGLIKYHVGREIEVISNIKGGNPPFSGSYVKGLTVDSNGHLWIGGRHEDTLSVGKTQWRAKLLEYDGNTFTSHDVGVSAEVPLSIKSDNQGRVWFLPTEEINWKDYDVLEYSVGPLCCFDNGEIIRYSWSQDAGHCYCVDVDGDSVYIGTDNGVLVFSDGVFRWLNSDETGIIETPSRQHTSSSFFDLQGRRIQDDPQHGVYIRNGKKVMR